MRRLLVVIGVVVFAGAGIAFAVTRESDQPEVAAGALPLLAVAHDANDFVDCSRINSVAYFADNPCQTFVLLKSNHFGSARAFWAAETRKLRMSGWRHSAPQLVDYDRAKSGMASRGESWVAPSRRACAYVTTDRNGVAAEKQSLFPTDPYDIPHGVYVFYRRAQAVTRRETLWVRLRRPNPGGRCIG